MQIYLSLMSQKNPSSDSSSYDLSSPQGRMLYVRETTNAAFSFLDFSPAKTGP